MTATTSSVPLCGYCKRPIVTAAIYAAGIGYHPECCHYHPMCLNLGLTWMHQHSLNEINGAENE